MMQNFRSSRLHRWGLLLLSLPPLAACDDPELANASIDTDAEFEEFEEFEGAAESSGGAPTDDRQGDSPDHAPSDALDMEREAGSICGSNDMIDVEFASADVQRMADAVGRIDYLGTPGCTGALVSENVMLTAGHCLDPGTINGDLGTNFGSPAGICTAVQVVFNAQDAGGVLSTNTPTFGCAQVLDQRFGNGYDYALIQLAGSPGSQFGFLEADLGRPIEDDDLTVIHHPSGSPGRPKQVSFDFARNVTNRKIVHRADTRGGSSGAPIIMDGRIVGVHTKGGCNFTGIGSNSGFSLDRIRLDSAWLRTTHYFDQIEDDAREGGDGFATAIAFGDLDGDKFDDIIISAPEEGIGLASGVGRVSYRFGSFRGLNPRRHGGFDQPGVALQSNSMFGEALAAGDFDGDGFDDIVVGTPRHDFVSVDAGSVDIIHGSWVGPNFSNTDHFVSSTFSGFVSSHARFGAALAVGDFNGDGFDDLAIGAPGEGLDGAVYVAYGSSVGLQIGSAEHFEQSDVGVDMSAGGEFGAALAAGDVDGDGRDDLVIGAPFEDVAGVPGAGYVTVIRGANSGLDIGGGTGFGQSIGTGSEPNDRFGEVITVGDFDGDGFADAAFGLPREDKGAAVDAGYIIVHEGTPGGLVPDRGFSRSSLDGTFSAYDYLGESLAASDLDGDGRDELVIGVPGDDGGQFNAGTLFVLPGTASGISPGSADELDISRVGSKTLFDNVGGASSLAAGDVDGDGDADLGAGIANQTTRTEVASGAVMVLDVD